MLIVFAAQCLGAGGAVIISSIKPHGDEKTVYLTLDACGGPKGSNLDMEIVNFLADNKIEATFFISGKWMNKNTGNFLLLAGNPLFKIENHGLNHKPASVTGMTVYGIKGTSSKQELLDEILINEFKIMALTGKRPLWYRSGTARYDEGALKIIESDLKLKIAGFAIAADEGATLPPDRVYENIMKAYPGCIILAHVNHPESGTAKGLKRAVTDLIKEGYVFRKLPDKI